MKNLNGELKKISGEMFDKGVKYTEKFEDLEKKIEIISRTAVEIGKDANECLSKHQSSLSMHSNDIKKHNTSLTAFEDHIKALRNTISTLSRPKTPEKRVATPPPPPPPIEFPLEEIYSYVENVKSELLQSITEEKGKTLNFMSEQVKALEMHSHKAKAQSDHAIDEIKDKLSWLPISLSQLEGMTPGEARLFTIEARVRSEENSRIQSYNHLLELIETCLSTHPHFEAEVFEVPKVEIAEKAKNTERKVKTPKIPIATQWWKKNQDSERRNYSDSGSVIGNKLKFSTPMPEMEEDLYSKYKENRRSKVVPKSWDIESTHIPRIQTAGSKSIKIGKANKIY